MKKNNAVLSMTILVLAVIGLLFTFLFFNNGKDFVNGWKKLASAISRSSGEMDKNNGTNYSKDLTVRNLQHEKYAQLDRYLMKLQAQSRAYAKSRDALAQAAAAIAARAGVQKSADAASLSKINDLSAVDNLKQEVDAVFENRDRTYANTAALTRSLGFSLDTGKLVRGDADALQPLRQGLSELSGRRNAYEAALKSIGDNTGVKSCDFSDSEYKETAKKLLSGLAKHQAAQVELDRKLKVVRDENQVLSAQSKKQQEQMAVRQEELARRERQIAGFREALHETAPVQEEKTPWLAGSREARAALTARVSDVDEDYGIVTINAGSETSVTQKIAEGKTHTVNVGITVGDEVIIVRGDLSGSPDYLTSLKLEKVDAKESVGRIPAGCTNLRTGDRVILRPAQTTAAN